MITRRNSSQEEGMVGNTTPVSTVLRLSPLGLGLDLDLDPHNKKNNKKTKKRGRIETQSDKTGPGLREISMKVLEKVKSKGRTTYSEVAEELVAEYGESVNALGTGDQIPEEADLKSNNINRRIYDALNVLVAMGIITKDKKEVQWKGLATFSDIDTLKRERMQLRKRIEKKATYLQELEEQVAEYENLARHNQQLHSNGSVPSSGVALPFILVKTKSSATVEVEISEDMKLVHFDFDSSPFELHDDKYVLKQMKLRERTQSNADKGTDMPLTGHPQVSDSQTPFTRPCHARSSQFFPPLETNQPRTLPHHH